MESEYINPMQSMPPETADQLQDKQDKFGRAMEAISKLQRVLGGICGLSWTKTWFRMLWQVGKEVV
jgi:hypothetical protein